MQKNKVLLLLAGLTILASCKKDEAKTNSAEIEGAYTFSSMHAKTNSTTTSDDGLKTVSLADWTTVNNMGTIVFKNGILTNSDFSYSVNSKATGYYYQNDILLDSVNIPLTVTIPKTNSTGTYKLVGADSIYFPAGSLVTYGNLTTSSNPGGGHYKLNGNQLILDISSATDSTFSDSGVMYEIKQSVEASIILTKQ
jgi:hypothetical protein